MGVMKAPGQGLVVQTLCPVECDGGFDFPGLGQGDLTHALQKRGHCIAVACQGTAHARHST